MNVHSIYRPFLEHFRTSRNARFIAATKLTTDTTVLDVGGTASFWDSMPVKPKVTLLNIRRAENCKFPQIVASACDMPFSDQSFDIVFSNSMIEHLGTWENQQAAAREMSRVGKQIWVQTPYRWFPVEPHLLTPFIHWFPHRYQRGLLPLTLWALISRPSAEYCDELWREIRLLTIRDMKKLFPECIIDYERFGGAIKSLIAVKTI